MRVYNRSKFVDSSLTKRGRLEESRRTKKPNQHERAFEYLGRTQSYGSYEVIVSNKKFVVKKGVFSPYYFGDAEFFSKAIPIKKGSSFLEVGSGAGVVSVTAALRGASKVAATDINQAAVENTIENARRHKVDVQATKGDVFSSVEKGRFDTIFWDIPFISAPKPAGAKKQSKHQVLQLAIHDEGYRAVGKYISEARKHLSPKGRLFIGFSPNLGNAERIKKLAKENGFSLKVIAEKQESPFIKLQLIELVPRA